MDTTPAVPAVSQPSKRTITFRKTKQVRIPVVFHPSDPTGHLPPPNTSVDGRQLAAGLRHLASSSSKLDPMPTTLILNDQMAIPRTRLKTFGDRGPPPLCGTSPPPPHIRCAPSVETLKEYTNAQLSSEAYGP
ncbi:unnamed protein product [Boreogadus saida]